jgi:hypothetical protein
MTLPNRDTSCGFCGGAGFVRTESQPTELAKCPRCNASVRIAKDGATEVIVTGHVASEVESVARQLAADMNAREQAAKLRSPWFSGLFYLTVVVVVGVLMLAIARLISAWALPVVIAGAALLVSVVGALQLRQDDRLSQRNFLALMGDSLRRLPVLFGRSRTDRPKDS